MSATRKERVGYSQAMRRNPTRAEHRLHKHLRWMRNHVGKKGKQLMMYTRQKLKREYILDFYFTRCRLAVEVDGGYHNTKKQKEYDLRRDERLAAIGIKTMRFTNEEVMDDLVVVAEKIYEEAKTRGLRKGKKKHANRKTVHVEHSEQRPIGPSTIHNLMNGLSTKAG